MLVRIVDAIPLSTGECWCEDISGLGGACLRVTLLVILTFGLSLVISPLPRSSHEEDEERLRY